MSVWVRHAGGAYAGPTPGSWDHIGLCGSDGPKSWSEVESWSIQGLDSAAGLARGWFVADTSGAE